MGDPALAALVGEAWQLWEERPLELPCRPLASRPLVAPGDQNSCHSTSGVAFRSLTVLANSPKCRVVVLATLISVSREAVISTLGTSV